MKTLNNFLETTEYNWIESQYIKAGKYVSAIKHIIENKPKFIVEYGGGKSTLLLTELVNYLDYGGKVVGYENDEHWYNYAIENGWNKHNNIKLVDTEESTENNAVGKGISRGIRYTHPMEDIEGVDFVIIDGPHLILFPSDPNVTFNLMDIVNHLGYELPYFIDGRSGTRNFYSDDLSYKTDIGDKKYEFNS